MPRPIHDWLEAHRPRGYVENAELQWENAEKYRLAARFSEFGMLPDEKLPGFSGIDGRIVATGSGGEAQFSSNGMDLRIDKVFRNALHLDRFATNLVWERSSGGKLRLSIGETQLTNTDLDATAQGVVEMTPGQAPVLDIQAHLTRGDGNAVWRYLPRQVSDHAHAWVKGAIVGGVSPDTRLVLKGPVDKFPFDKGGGEFQVTIQAKDARLAYAPGWPEIHAINGQVVFRGSGMFIEVQNAKCSGVDIGPVSASIPDLHSGDKEVLRVDGKARGATPAFLQFIRDSPVYDHTGRFTDRLKVQGQGALNLTLSLPLRDLADATVRGDYRMHDNRVEPGEGLPELTHLDGTLLFSEDWVRGAGIATYVFGEPAQLSIHSETGGRLKVGLNGRVGAAGFKAWLPTGMDRYLSGSAAYEAEVSLKAQQTMVKIKSDLVGVESKLPAPMRKSADQNMPFSISTGEGQGGGTVYTVQYGQVLSGKMLTRPGEPTQALLYLGGGSPAVLPRDSGLVVLGALRRLDLDAWDALDLGLGGSGGAGLTLKQANVNIAELRASGREFHDTRIKVTPVHRGWRAEIQGREVIGEVIYGEAGGLPGKRFTGHFQRLAIPSLSPAEGPVQERPDTAELPRIVEINAQSFALGEREIGQLNTMLEAERTGLRTRNLVISNSDGRLQGSGWVSASHRQETEFDINLESANAGKLLARLGINEGIKNGPANLDGKVKWLGRPEDFAIANLGGHLKLRMKGGRFTQLDPGAGRLLGILSLQALPRRVVLDFRDVFSEGFSFDSIEGDVHLERGVAYLPDLLIRGPSAIVHMKGRIDLANETQDLRVTIQPRLDDSLAVAGALLGGPAVGVGTLVATKLLQNPVGKAATFEYLIKGTWNEPEVTKLARPKPVATDSTLNP
jgi:uncharacterized protein (TIGR02099 family)